ncbi:hypothetical protein Tco_1438647 [Tanacetum coccineum]
MDGSHKRSYPAQLLYTALDTLLRAQFHDRSSTTRPISIGKQISGALLMNRVLGGGDGIVNRWRGILRNCGLLCWMAPHHPVVLCQGGGGQDSRLDPPQDPPRISSGFFSRIANSGMVSWCSVVGGLQQAMLTPLVLLRNLLRIVIVKL